MAADGAGIPTFWDFVDAEEAGAAVRNGTLWSWEDGELGQWAEPVADSRTFLEVHGTHSVSKENEPITSVRTLVKVRPRPSPDDLPTGVE